MIPGKQNGRFRVGLIGYGVGKLYAAAFKSANLNYGGLPQIELAAIATASKESSETAIRQFGFERSTQKYQDILESYDIDAVIIASPNNQHYPMLVKALHAGKAIYTDKPLALNLKEAKEIQVIARKTGQDAQLIFQYRYCPAVVRAEQIISGGKMGKLQSFRFWHYRSSYINPDKPLRWKGSFQTSGGGVVADLLPHSFDLLIWMFGMPARLSACGRIFVTERPAAPGNAQLAQIDTEDHAIILAEMQGGAIGTFEAGRMAVGTVNDMGFEIFGSKGSLRWEAMNPNYLQYAGPGLEGAEGGRAWLPTMQKLTDASILPAGLTVGMIQFYIDSAADFVKRTCASQPYDAGIDQGVRVQALIEAVMSSYKNQGAWVPVEEG
jgi:predicted dehydrogenase